VVTIILLPFGDAPDSIHDVLADYTNQGCSGFPCSFQEIAGMVALWASTLSFWIRHNHPITLQWIPVQLIKCRYVNQGIRPFLVLYFFHWPYFVLVGTFKQIVLNFFSLNVICHYFRRRTWTELARNHLKYPVLVAFNLPNILAKNE
jgi:hypothetical protein